MFLFWCFSRKYIWLFWIVYFPKSLELLKADVLKWHTKKEWYEAINEVHEKKAKLENEIAWAQVEDYEKKASQALIVKEKQTEEIQRVC